MRSMQPLKAVILCVAVSISAPASQAQTTPTEGEPQSFQALVTDIQSMLTELGYRPGGVDGKMGERTQQAIRRYQSNTGLPVDGHPSQALREHLLATTGRAPTAAASSADESATARTSSRKAAWQGEMVADAQLRVAPSDASASTQSVAVGTAVDVIRRQGRWLEVRLGEDGAEGWVKQVSVRAAATGSAPSASEKKSGGFFAGLARGISRLLGGSSDAPGNQGSVTVGVRGLAPEDLASTIPDPAELEEMESYRADEQQALRFAAEERLTTVTVEYLQSAPAAAPAPSASGGRN